MEHIEFALSVLRSEIVNLERELEEEPWLPRQEDEIKQDIQKLNQAMLDIQHQFNLNR